VHFSDLLHDVPNARLFTHVDIRDSVGMLACTYPPRGRARLRKCRHSEPGRIYLITFATASRRAVFAQWEPALAAIRALYAPILWHDARLLCWVLMPDHWHGLIELGTSQSLSTTVGRLKGRVARATHLADGESAGALWANGFHDHAVRADEDLLDVARYIVLNPVRAGLVTHVQMYPFRDCVWLGGEEQSG